MTPKVIDAHPLDDYRPALRFSHGQTRVFNVKPYLDRGAFVALKSLDVLNSVHVSSNTVEWSNGVDLCPEVLYEESVGVPAAARRQ
jgi:hypothetical protein